MKQRVKAWAVRKADEEVMNWWEDGHVSISPDMDKSIWYEREVMLPATTNWNEQDFHALHVNDWSNHDQQS